MSIKKDVALVRAARGRRTKKSNLAPKKIPTLLPGHVEARMVKCGKPGCKCARGELHGPYFYHRTWADGVRSKSYVRRADAARTARACKAHRDLQTELRAGRVSYRLLLARVRELFG